jgi:hypothetical protein
MLPTKTSFKIVKKATTNKPMEEQRVSFLKRVLLDPTSMLLGWSNAYPTKFNQYGCGTEAVTRWFGSSLLVGGLPRTEILRKG